MPGGTGGCVECAGTLFVEGRDGVRGFENSSMYESMKTSLFKSITTSRMNLKFLITPQDEAELRNKHTPRDDNGVFINGSIFDSMQLQNFSTLISITEKRKFSDV